MTNSNKKKTASKLFLKTRPLLTSTALISIAATANAQQIQRGDEVEFSLEQIAGDTKGGGPWVAEKEQDYKRGIITAIEVCSEVRWIALQFYMMERVGLHLADPVEVAILGKCQLTNILNP